MSLSLSQSSEFCRHKSRRCFALVLTVVGMKCCPSESAKLRGKHKKCSKRFRWQWRGRTQNFEWLFSIHRWGNVRWILRGECPPTGGKEEHVEKVRKIINDEQWRMISEIADSLGLSYVTCLRIIREGLSRWWISSSTYQHPCIHAMDICHVSSVGWIILGWISRRWDVGMWTGLGWPRIGTGGGRLWVR